MLVALAVVSVSARGLVFGIPAGALVGLVGGAVAGAAPGILLTAYESTTTPPTASRSEGMGPLVVALAGGFYGALGGVVLGAVAGYAWLHVFDEALSEPQSP